MKSKKMFVLAMIVSSLLFMATVSVQGADEVITDPVGDVAALDLSYNTNTITSSPYVTVANLDITGGTYTNNAGAITLTLTVDGIIEGRGSLADLQLENPVVNVIGYQISLTTDEEIYSITYVNGSCQLMYADSETVNLTGSDFSVTGDTLTVSFTVKAVNEVFDSLDAQVVFIKMNIPEDMSDIDDLDEDALAELYITLLDIAPNLPISTEDIITYVSNVGLVGETIQFNASVSPLSGQPPFEYSWDFGDGSTPSEELNPTHVYEKAGEYDYNFTVTDQSGTSVSYTDSITITQEGGETPLSNQMILFIALLLIVIIVGIIVIVWIIRR